MVKLNRVVVKFKKETVIIQFVGDKCTVRDVKKKKPSSSWKKLVSGHRKSGVRRFR